MQHIGIVGANGFVGKAMQKLFPDSVLYDKTLENTSIEQINRCEIAIICVPTNLQDDKTLDMSIVESVVKQCTCPLIIIRSTLMPGTADRLSQTYNKNICFVPEYVGETVAHPLLDESARPFLILGGRPQDRRQAIELYQSVYNANISIRQVTLYEAEVIKLSENRAIAFKIAQCQELFDVCQKAKIDYNVIREAVYGDDPRFNLWWTFVYPNKRGFQSKCLPKDVYGWAAWAESLGYEPKLTDKLLSVNEEYIK